ncbi:MAG TPA: hypothetical protein PL033_10275 [Candidatus Brocadiia bacterium]|nr:hypothetical protein [Candidatus Brocadiia bacterium]
MTHLRMAARIGALLLFAIVSALRADTEGTFESLLERIERGNRAVAGTSGELSLLVVNQAHAVNGKQNRQSASTRSAGVMSEWRSLLPVGMIERDKEQIALAAAAVGICLQDDMAFDNPSILPGAGHFDVSARPIRGTDYYASIAALAVADIKPGAALNAHAEPIVASGQKRYADFDWRRQGRRSPEAMSAWGDAGGSATAEARLNLYTFNKRELMARIDSSAVSAEALFSTSFQFGSGLKVKHGGRYYESD